MHRMLCYVTLRTKTSPLRGYLHREEFLITHIIPGFLGEVLLHRYVVVVKEGAECVDLMVEKGLLFG